MKHRKRIFAVADDVTNRTVYGEIFEQGHHLRIVGGEDNCINVAGRFCPDLILLDTPLAGFDGAGLCRDFRKEPQLKYARIVICSSNTQEMDRARAMEAGAHDFMVMPVEEEELIARVRVNLRIKETEEVDRLYSRLLNLIAREGRKALDRFRGIAALLSSDSNFSEEELGSYGAILAESGGDLHDLMENARTLASIRSDGLHLERESVSLCDLVGSSLKELSPLASRRKITLQERHSASPVLQLDRDKMERVVMFLLKNAIHVSPWKGIITASISTWEDTVQLTIADSGIGLRTTQPLRDLDESHDRSNEEAQGKCSISLAVARSIIEEHSGTIRVECKAGTGSVFTVQLPDPAWENSRGIRGKGWQGIQADHLQSHPPPVKSPERKSNSGVNRSSSIGGKSRSERDAPPEGNRRE